MFVDWQNKLKRIVNRVVLFDIPIATTTINIKAFT